MVINLLCHKTRASTTRKSTSKPASTEGFAGLADQCFERCWFVHSQICQNFPVNFDAGFAKTVDKPAIR